MSQTVLRLWLIGDDEALDILADLSRHLDYFAVSRADEPPAEPLGADDHIIIGLGARDRSLHLLGLVLSHGHPGYAGIISDGEDSAGARAILAGASLVTALRGVPKVTEQQG